MPEISGDARLIHQIDALKKEILKLKQRQAQLSQDQRRFHTIFNSMTEMYFEVDLKGDLIHFSPSLAKLTGYTPDELIGKNNRAYTSPETAACMYRVFNNILATGKTGEFPIMRLLLKMVPPGFCNCPPTC